MTEEIVLVESCQGFWSCLDANTIMISIITLGGVFASSLLTYYLTTRQHKIDVFVGHKEFYSTVDGLDKWLSELTKRITLFENFNSIETLKDEVDTLEFLAKEVTDSIVFDDAPYPLNKPLLNILQLTLRVRGYTIKLIERTEAENLAPINMTEVQKAYKDINKELKKNHRKIKKYL